MKIVITVMGTEEQHGEEAFNALFGWGDHEWLKEAINEKPAPPIILAPESQKQGTGGQSLWGKDKAKNP